MERIMLYYLAIGIGIGAIVYTLRSVVVDILKERTEKKYERIFEKWFGKGNRILKIREMVFVLTFRWGDDGGIVIYCDGKNCYRFNLYKKEIGQMISSQKYPHNTIKCREAISKEAFIDELITSDHSVHEDNFNDGIRYVFSFDSVDMGLLPDWVTAELVAKKLEGS